MASADGYDVFISYSHEQDDWFAEGLKTGLERFARPWYRTRGLRVFRDTASLSASPELWGSIEAALRASRWFILLTSPSAARSAWIDREVAWWLASKPPGRLLIVATAAPLHWDETEGDWAADAPVPPSLRGTLGAEPLWVDLTRLRSDAASPAARVPSEDLATIAAPVRGVDRDTLIGEHLRQRRRTMRTVRAVIAGLTALLLAAVTATIVAVNQRNTARTEARIATSRLLAAEAVAQLGAHLDIGQLLAVAAYELDHDPQTTAALLRAASASPHLVRFLPAAGTVTALAASADGKTLVAGTADGRLQAIDVATGHAVTAHATNGAITMLSVSADGRAVAAANATEAVAWAPGATRAVPITGIRSPSSVAVSPSGQLIAVYKAALVGGATGGTLVIRAADGAERTARVPDWYSWAAFPSESSLVLTAQDGWWQRMDPATLKVTMASSLYTAPHNGYIAGMAADGSYGAYVKYGRVSAYSTDHPTYSGSTQQGAAGGGSGQVPDAPATVITVRADGRQAAVLESGVIYLTPLDPVGGGSQSVVSLAGGAATQVTYLGTGERLASASGTSIALWDTGQATRIGVPASPALDTPPNSAWEPTILPKQAGGWVLLVSDDSSGVPNQEYADGRPLRHWAGPLGSGVSGGRFLADGELEVVGPGGVQSYNLSSGAGRQLPHGTGLRPWPALGAVSVDGRAAAASDWAPSVDPRTLKGVTYADLRTGKSHLVGTGAAVGVAFSRDSLLIERATGVLEVWDSAGQRRLRTIPGTGGTPELGLAVSPDGTLTARLNSDGTVSLTDTTTGNVLADLELPAPQNSTSADPWAQTAMAFTADGHTVLTATMGGQVFRWAVDPPDLTRSVCATVGRPLTAAEWQQYAAVPPPAILPCTP